MYTKRNLNISSSLLKGFAVFIICCYIAQPLHKQIGVVLHELSHFLEIPENYIAVSSDHTLLHHQLEKHQVKISAHDHELLEAIESVFDQTQGQNSSEHLLLSLVKYKKHLIQTLIRVPNNLNKSTKNATIHHILNERSGHFLQLFEPPKLDI